MLKADSDCSRPVLDLSGHRGSTSHEVGYGVTVYLFAVRLFAMLSLVAAAVAGGRADDEASPPSEKAGLFKQLDANGDGQLAPDEVSDDHRRLFGRLLRRGDANADGKLSLEELTAALADERPQPPPQPAGQQPAQGGERFRQFLQVDPEQLFKQLDANGDGRIVLDEVPQQARARLEPFFQYNDANSDKALSLEEFRQGHERLRAQAGIGQPTPARPGGLLRVLDTDGDGKLSKEEIAAASESLRKLDKDNDGEVSQRELAAVFSPQPGQAPSPPDARPSDGAGRPNAARLLERLRSMDAEGDGKWSESELPPFLRQQFAKIDANKDGFVDADELRQALPSLRRPGQ